MSLCAVCRQAVCEIANHAVQCAVDSPDAVGRVLAAVGVRNVITLRALGRTRHAALGCFPVNHVKIHDLPFCKTA